MTKITDFQGHAVPSRMRALVLEEYNGRPRVIEKAVPRPMAGEVLIRVAATPVNPSDWAFINGWYGSPKPLPVVPGLEGSGVVVASGSGLMPRWLRGKRVACAAAPDRDGMWSEYVVTRASFCVPLRKAVDMQDAATMLVNPFSAWALLDMARRNKQVAIANTAAASAIGRMILRLSHSLGIQVVCIVRRSDQRRLLQEMGAVHVLDSTADHFEIEMQELFERTGVGIAFDAVSGEMTGRLLNALPDHGQVVVYGGLSETAIKVNPAEFVFKHKRVEGFWLPRWASRQNALTILRVSRYIQQRLNSEFETHIRSQTGLDGAVEAIGAYMDAMTSGKVLIIPSGSP